MIKRNAVALSATGLLAIAGYEGFSAIAYQPLPGDKPTIGFGSTSGVKMGDTISVPKALERLHRDIGDAESAIGSCVKVPLSQGEYDAYTSLAFHIGTRAFCDSTLVRLLNKGKYDEACKQILRFDKMKKFKDGKVVLDEKGKPVMVVVPGFVKRRKQEYERCLTY